MVADLSSLELRTLLLVPEHSGRATLELPDSKAIRDVQSVFLQLISDQFGIGRELLYAMQVQLFLSMIPLHADDPGRQQAFLANALRLYSEID